LMLKFIKEVIKNNYDLKIAALNMNKSWLLAKQAGSALYPTLDLSINQTEQGVLDDTDVPNSKSGTIALQTSWELDLWGRISSGVKSAEAHAQSVEADYLFAQYSLSAGVAKNYIKIIETKLQTEIAIKNLKIIQEIVRITEAKYESGASSSLDVALGLSNLSSAQEQLIIIKKVQRDSMRALEFLLGRYPNAQLEVANKLPNTPPPPSVGLPSQILERRPDIISAERNIASAFDATEQKKAARLPSFSLTGTLASTSDSLSNAVKFDTVGWQLSANILAPLFDAGRRKIDMQIATETQKQAVVNYTKTAMSAFLEVEKNLDQGVALSKRQIQLLEAQKQSNKAYNIAQLRYKEGEISLLDTIQIQQKAIVADSNVLSIKQALLEQRINLYLSLGGSW